MSELGTMASVCSNEETQESDPPGTALATAISKGTVSDELLERCTQEGCHDFPDVDGKTPLMLACLKGLENVVKFLLENGANPNSKSSKDGNTPLHYACMLEDSVGTANFDERLNKQVKWRTPQISMLKLLMKHGAGFQKNRDGWTPVCVAAFYLLNDFVHFFLSMGEDEISLEDKIKASEILGVVQATVDRIPAKDAFHSLYRAIDLKECAGFKKEDTQPSELANCFSHLSLKECHTLDEIRAVESSERALKAHAFLVGERLFPPSLLQRYFYPALVYFAYLIMYLEEDVERGFQIFSHVLKLEGSEEAVPGTVLLQVSYAYHFHKVYFAFEDEPEPQVRQLTKDMLSSYIKILENMHIDCLLDVCHKVVERFSVIVFSETLTYSGSDVLKFTLQDIETLMNIIRSRIHREGPVEYKIPSLVFEIMTLVMVQEGRVLFDCETFHRKSMLVKIRYLILRVLQTDDATYRHRSSGNTLLHFLAMSTFAAVYTGCVTRVMRCIKDLAEAFVRHGCPVDAINSDGQTARDIMQEVGLTRSNFKLIEEVMSPQTTVLHLQELAVRAVLRHKINYKGILPARLDQMIGRVTDADFDLQVLGRLENKRSRFESDSSDEDSEDDDITCSTSDESETSENTENDSD